MFSFQTCCWTKSSSRYGIESCCHTLKYSSWRLSWNIPLIWQGLTSSSSASRETSSLWTITTTTAAHQWIVIYVEWHLYYMVIYIYIYIKLSSMHECYLNSSITWSEIRFCSLFFWRFTRTIRTCSTSFWTLIIVSFSIHKIL